MKPIPPELLRGPFTRARAVELEVTSRQLEDARFVRLLPRVHRYAGHAARPDRRAGGGSATLSIV